MPDDHVIATEIAVRGYPTEKPRAFSWHAQAAGDAVVVLDTETRIDLTQRLLVGSYRVYTEGRLVQEGLIAADDFDEHERGILARYVASHAADTGGRLVLRTRADFCDAILWKTVYGGLRATLVGFNLPFDLSRLAIGWRRIGKGDLRGGFYLDLFDWQRPGGARERHQWRPSIAVKTIDSKRHLMSFATPARLDPEHRDEQGRAYRGRFVDLHTLAFALTDRNYSLRRAGEAFGAVERKAPDPPAFGALTAELIDYNRQDVRATYALYEVLIAEYRRHPLELPPGQAYSAAAIGKAYLRSFNVRPPLLQSPDFPVERLGHAMTAYYGGRAEVRLRRVDVPVTYLDVTAMYPTVLTLGELWRWLVADRLTAVDATGHAQRLLDDVSIEKLLDPGVWPQLAGVFCRIDPAGELVPVRAPYRHFVGGEPASLDERDAAWQIGLNHLDGSSRPLWYSLADLLASRLLGGPPTTVREAFRILATGVQDDLRYAALRGGLLVDLTSAGRPIFARLVEERQRVARDATIEPREREWRATFLKTVANAVAYGIAAEIRQDPALPRDKRVPVAGLELFQPPVRTPERPGEYAFPPLAASVPALGRLLLALLQGQVEALGGHHLAADTDGLVVVASVDGGDQELPNGDRIKLLCWADVDAIRGRLNTLNPYDRELVPDLVRLEDENFAPLPGPGDRVDRDRRIDLRGMAISTKRFALYESGPDGRAVLRKRSEHGLGVLLDPTRVPHPQDDDEGAQDWIDVAWQRLVARVRDAEPGPEPAWFERPALSQLGCSSPALLSPFAAFNRGRPYADQVKPFSFVLLAHDDPLSALPPGLDRDRLTLVAPFDADPGRWLGLDWRNRVDSRRVRVTIRPDGSPGAVRIRTYGDLLAAYATHPEAKASDPDGRPAGRRLRGRLGYLHLRATSVEHIGKESNQLDEVAAGAVPIVEDPTVRYLDRRGEWEAALPRLRELREARGAADLCERSGLSRKSLYNALTGGRLPREPARSRLLALADDPAPPGRGKMATT
jgi:hypothetical protein